MLCGSCGHVQLRNVVDPDAIYREYTYTSSISLGLVDHFVRYADDVLQRSGRADLVTSANDGEADKARSTDLVVEIGSNEGAMLRAFKARGRRVLGVDPARQIAAAATAAAIETLPDYFTPELARRIRQQYGAASIVVANNVFANIDDVATAVDGIRDLLTPGGIFVFETSYLLDVVQHALLDTIFHEHLSYFAIAPLQKFFAARGMTLVDVVHVPTKGGSIRVFVQAAPDRPASREVTAMVDAENAAGLFGLDAYTRLGAMLDAQRRALHAVLDDAKDRGQTIAAYGAAVGLTTMLYQFELGQYVSYIVDDNAGKHGTFSPGLHLPVLPSSVLEERQPEYTILLAWRYAEPIMKKHTAYTANGGRFILPLPEVHVTA